MGTTLIVREPIGVCGADHAVELADQPDRLQGRAGARRRLHDGAEADRGRAAQRDPLRRDPARGRRAGRRVQPRERRRRRPSARRSSSHPDVDMVSFTGSTRAGIEVAQAAAPTREARRRRSSAASRPTSSSTTPTSPTVVAGDMSRHVQQLGPVLQRADAHARAGGPHGRGRRDRRRRRPRTSSVGDPHATATSNIGPVVSRDAVRARSSG